MKNVIDHLRRLVVPPDEATSDSQLLSRFIAAQDQPAFALLVRRHGPMVLGVCRRVLRNQHDAEDAFQAAFFILARKAASVVKRESLSSWLHSVAYRAALEAKAVQDRRRTREQPMGDHPHPAVAPAEAQDWRPILDHELGELPDKYRAALILSDLEGRTRKEIARLLSVPEGTVSSRLATARQLLAKRLARRGLSLTATMLAAALLKENATASVPISLALATAKAAMQFAAGQTAALATPAAVLTTGVFKTMLMTKLKTALASLMVAIAIGVSGLAAYTTMGAGTALAQDDKAKSDAEALRKENDLLRRSLELALDKVRAQEATIKSLTALVKSAPARESTVTKTVTRAAEVNIPKAVVTEAYPGKATVTEAKPKTTTIAGDVVPPLKKAQAEKLLEMLKLYQSELKQIQDLQDPDAAQRACESLEKALKGFTDSLKPAGEAPKTPAKPDQGK